MPPREALPVAPSSQACSGPPFCLLPTSITAGNLAGPPCLVSTSSLAPQEWRKRLGSGQWSRLLDCGDTAHHRRGHSLTHFQFGPKAAQGEPGHREAGSGLSRSEGQPRESAQGATQRGSGQIPKSTIHLLRTAGAKDSCTGRRRCWQAFHLLRQSQGWIEGSQEARMSWR